jgi:hypothetical protein
LLIVGLLAIARVVLIIKWALITAAIIVVPFGIWWVLDRAKQREQAQAVLARAGRRARSSVEPSSTPAGAAAGAGPASPTRTTLGL